MSGPGLRAPRGALAVSFAVALAARVAHAAVTDVSTLPKGDNTFFVETARSVATGSGGRLLTYDGSTAMSVKFPPLWPWTLALGQRLFFFVSADQANAITRVLLGATVAPLVGLLTWRVLDRVPESRRRIIAVGAALLAALHPLLIGATNSLMSEVVVVPVSLAILLALHRVHRLGPATGNLAALGVWVGLATLLRPEAIFMWGLAIGVTALVARRPRIVVVPIALALVAPLAYSAVASRAAHRPIFVSTNAASAVAGANCERTWSGEAIGHWSTDCLDEVWLGRIPIVRRSVIYFNERRASDEPRLQLGPVLEGDLQEAQQRYALFKIRRHPAEFVRAVPFRLARGLGVWWSPNQTRLETAEGRSPTWELAGRWVHILLVLPGFALAATGAVRRRGRVGQLLERCADPQTLSPWGVAVVVWAAGMAATHGSTRHRSAVDAILLVGAAIGWAMLAEALATRRGDGGGQPPVVVVADADAAPLHSS